MLFTFGFWFGSVSPLSILRIGSPHVPSLVQELNAISADY